MNKTNIAFIIGILLGGLIGIGGSYTIYNPQIENLKLTLNEKETNYNELENNYTTLYYNNKNLENQQNTLSQNYQITIENYANLQNNLNTLYDIHNNLQDNYDTLSKNYQHLETEYNRLLDDNYVLENEYNLIKGYYEQITQDIEELNEMLNSLCLVEASIQRVLNLECVETLNDTISTITQGISSFWSAYEEIFDYTQDNLDYVHDTEYPILGISYRIHENKQYMSEISTYFRPNYIQTPEFTLTNAQGDCDDQAVLLYAMLKNYQLFIHGTDYWLYLMRIELTDTSHISVLQPVQGPNICILDPAGHYLTSNYGNIASKDATEELKAYSDYWGNTEYGEIQSITLYDIDIETATYDIVISGTLEEVENWLALD